MNHKFLALSVATLFIAFGLLTTTAQAQYQDMALGGSNTVLAKLYPVMLSPTPRFGIAGAVEFKVAEASTLQLDGQFGLGYTERTYKVQYNYFGVQYRYYFNGFEGFDGFYGGAQFGFGTASFQDATDNTSASHYAIPVGIVAGYQFKLTNKLYLDVYFGPQVAVGAKFEKGGNNQNYTSRAYDGLTLRSGLGLAYGF